MNLRAIGHIETPYEALEDCPRNIDPDGPMCRLVIDPAYVDGLLGLDAGERILILYWMSEADRSSLRRTSRKTGKYAGVFALRSPHRPNPVAAAVVAVERCEDGALWVRGMDCINGTPLLDIKPAMKVEQGEKKREQASRF